MKKSERIEEFIRGLAVAPNDGKFDARYLGYFECFNSGSYYEAHDVLEHLWLGEGRQSPDYAYYKGLIQLAGGFVHLKLQFDHPAHPKHGRRLQPARRLFLLAEANLASYKPWHLGLKLHDLIGLACRTRVLLEKSGCSGNPWNPKRLPLLPIPVARKGSD
jgi:hypothetical protein